MPRKTKQPEAPKYCTVRQVAERLALSIPKVHTLLQAGHLKCLRLPGGGNRVAVRVLLSSVEDLERACSAG